MAKVVVCAPVVADELHHVVFGHQIRVFLHEVYIDLSDSSEKARSNAEPLTVSHNVMTVSLYSYKPTVNPVRYRKKIIHCRPLYAAV